MLTGHTGTTSITVLVRRARWNGMKPRIQCVLTQWKPGSIASGGVRERVELHDRRVRGRTDFYDQLLLSRIALELHERGIHAVMGRT